MSYIILLKWLNKAKWSKKSKGHNIKIIIIILIVIALGIGHFYSRASLP